MPPSVCLPPLEFCLGVRPSQAAKSRPDLNTLGSGTLAAITEAIIFPMPGTLSSNRTHLILRMGAGDFLLQIVDRFVEPLKSLGQNLHARLGGVRKRRIAFG